MYELQSKNFYLTKQFFFYFLLLSFEQSKHIFAYLICYSLCGLELSYYEKSLIMSYLFCFGLIPNDKCARDCLY